MFLLAFLALATAFEPANSIPQELSRRDPVPANPDALQTYTCVRASTAPALDARLNAEPWTSAAWTQAFISIDGNLSTPIAYATYAAMIYDDNYLYLAAKMEEPNVWADLVHKNTALYTENPFEIFINPAGDGLNYHELEINALNTLWELTLTKPWSEGGTATNPDNIPGLIHNVYVDGTVNDPTDTDKGWNVEIAIPWTGLAAYNLPDHNTPPLSGDVWRIQFARSQWDFAVTTDEAYVRVPDMNVTDLRKAAFWSAWTSDGVFDAHVPRMWGNVTFR
ncbi:hypothetical protein BC830DRAFT_341343 [Chytriomyces sp. MP71]|nr:hypothetical protein BC830DRAFT_341343 [Chytriomyces sp. MP71]